MHAIEGLTIFHVIAAVLGILLFMVALCLLIRAAIKSETYPRSLLYFFAFGVALVIYPATGKFLYGEIIGDLPKLIEEVQANPGDIEKQVLLEKTIDRVDKSLVISPKTTSELILANAVIENNELMRANEPIPVK